jgi:hypothetical protein
LRWNKVAIRAAIKQVLHEPAERMPQLAMPVRVLVMGTPQTPSLDAHPGLDEPKRCRSTLESLKNIDA